MNKTLGNRSKTARFLWEYRDFFEKNNKAVTRRDMEIVAV